MGRWLVVGFLMWTVGCDPPVDSGLPDAHVERGSCDVPDTRQRAACAAAVLTACDPLPSGMGWTELIVAQRFPFETTERRECLLRAGANCAAAQDCIGRWEVPTAGDGLPRCDGDIIVRPWRGGVDRRIDCTRTAPGNRCLLVDTPRDPDSGAPLSQQAVCSTEACLATPDFSSCYGDDLESCGSTIADRSVMECDPGFSCQRTDVYDCTPEGPPCDAAPNHCEGNVSVGCHHGREFRNDCTVIGTTCREGFCDEVPILCDGTYSTTTCDGDELVYCWYSRVTRVSCRDLGFSGCDGARGTCTPAVTRH